NGGEPATLALLAYPAADVVLIAAVCYLLAQLRRGGRDSVSLTLIAAALVLIGASDAGHAYAALSGAEGSGGPADLGWFAGFALVALAARRRDRAGSGDNGGEGTDGQQPFASVLPYAA